MSSNSKKQPEESKISRFLYSVVRFAVSVWHIHEERMRWAVVVALMIFLLTGELFTKNGLIFLLVIIPPPILIYFLEKWLEKHEDG